MMNNGRRNSKAVAATAAILGLCLTALILMNERQPPSYEPKTNLGRRSLLGETIKLMQAEQHRIEEEGGNTSTEDGIYSWAETSLVPISAEPNIEKETAIFWHIPKSGGTTSKMLYHCMAKTIKVLALPPDIKRAHDSGLEDDVDMIFSSFPDYTAKKLFDDEHRGRVLAMFRHPVERLISKFYYLQVATWERAYHPDWKELSLLEWVQHDKDATDYESYVKSLAGKTPLDDATEEDLELAKRTIQSYFVIGLMNDMETSIKRFNVFMGIEKVRRGRYVRCMEKYFPKQSKAKQEEEGTKANSNPHPKVEKDDPAYKLLAEKNSLDIQLYEYIELLYDQQKELIENYKTASDAQSQPIVQKK